MVVSEGLGCHADGPIGNSPLIQVKKYTRFLQPLYAEIGIVALSLHKTFDYLILEILLLCRIVMNNISMTLRLTQRKLSV